MRFRAGVAGCAGWRREDPAEVPEFVWLHTHYRCPTLAWCTDAYLAPESNLVQRTVSSSVLSSLSLLTRQVRYATGPVRTQSSAPTCWRSFDDVTEKTVGLGEVLQPHERFTPQKFAEPVVAQPVGVRVRPH